MNVLLTTAGFLTLGIWVYLVLFRGGFWRLRDDSHPVGTPPERSVCVVIPARDEAATIGNAVRSLVRQRARVIVVDDHSIDNTAALAQAAGATVVAAPPLAAGWTGKLWAVAAGVEHAAGADYVLLTDADIEHAPDSILSLVSRAEALGLDLASFMVRLRAENLAERMMIPAFVFFFLKLYPPRWIAEPGVATAGAAGGCILIRSSALARIGGIAAIRGELIDDCALARAVKHSGGRIWMGLTSTTRSIRPYESMADIRAMISRTAFTQLRHSTLLLAGTVAGMLLTYIAPPALLVSGHAPAAMLGGAAWLLMAIAYTPTLRLYGRSPAWALLLSAVAVLYSAATVESAIRYWTGSGGMWKGRAQDLR